MAGRPRCVRGSASPGTIGGTPLPTEPRGDAASPRRPRRNRRCRPHSALWRVCSTRSCPASPCELVTIIRSVWGGSTPSRPTPPPQPLVMISLRDGDGGRLAGAQGMGEKWGTGFSARALRSPPWRFGFGFSLPLAGRGDRASAWWVGVMSQWNSLARRRRREPPPTGLTAGPPSPQGGGSPDCVVWCKRTGTCPPALRLWLLPPHRGRPRRRPGEDPPVAGSEAVPARLCLNGG